MEEKKSFSEKLHSILNKMGTMALMNAMYLIACIPIVTIGPAWNGLLTAIRYHVRGDKWFAGFKFGFKTRFWRSFLSFNIMLLPILYFVPEEKRSAVDWYMASMILHDEVTKAAA